MKTLIRDYLNEVKGIADSLSQERTLKKIAEVVVIIYDAWLAGNKVYLCGNGGSASTATHFASDLLSLGVSAVCLNDNVPRLTATANDRGFENIFSEQVVRLIQGGDVLIAISVHGGGQDRGDGQWWSQNLPKAVDCAKQLGARTIGLVGFEGGILNRICDVSIKVNVYSTPQVESWHCHIAHLICEILNGFRPVKMCVNCQRIHKSDFCSECGDPRFTLVRGVMGNIEDIKKEPEPQYYIKGENRYYSLKSSG